MDGHAENEYAADADFDDRADAVGTLNELPGADDGRRLNRSTRQEAFTGTAGKHGRGQAGAPVLSMAAAPYSSAAAPKPRQADGAAAVPYAARGQDRMLPAGFRELGPETAAAVFCLANALQRDAVAWGAAYADISAPALTVPTALSHALVSPWRRPEELRAPNRIGNWLFWLDDVIEGSDSDTEVDDLVEGCAAVAAGTRPTADHSLLRALGDIRGELAAAPLWPYLASHWQERVTRTAAGYRSYREFSRALAAGTPPSAAEYMSVTLGVELTRITYLIAAEDTDAAGHAQLLLHAITAQDHAHRLVNDIRTFDRDCRDGDINVLFLGVTPQQAAAQADAYVAYAHSLLQPLVADGMRAAIEVDRQTSFTIAFYQAMDYRP